MLRSTLGLGILLAATFAGESVFGETVAAPRRDIAGAVFTMSNSPAGNSVVAFDRAANGLLSSSGSLPTGGLGSGDGLGNQGAVVLGTDDRWLFVVNAGSHDVSVFRLNRDGLELVGVTDSGGARPISVTVHRDVVYVLNAGGQAGGSDNIAGFRLDTDGGLSYLEGSAQSLSAASTAPAQIEFSPDGRFLVVTEKATSIIDVYAVRDGGLAGPAVSYESAAPTPFGFAFGNRGQLFVSEAVGGAPDASSVSSYFISRDDGALHVISPAVPTTETAACWLAVSNDRRFAYTTNGGSASVSGFAIDFEGSISLLDADGKTGDTGQTPLDMAFSRDGRYIYTLDVGDRQLSVFRVQADGSLVPLRSQGGLPQGVNGLAAR